jgi:hypothetical protein
MEIKEKKLAKFSILLKLLYSEQIRQKKTQILV